MEDKSKLEILASAKKTYEQALAMCGPRDENEAGSLSGQELLDALTQAHKNGHYKGWSFRELSQGGSALPMTVYDQDADGHPIVRHTIVSLIGRGPCENTSHIEISITTPEGTVYQDFHADEPPKERG